MALTYAPSGHPSTSDCIGRRVRLVRCSTAISDPLTRPTPGGGVCVTPSRSARDHGEIAADSRRKSYRRGAKTKRDLRSSDSAIGLIGYHTDRPSSYQPPVIIALLVPLDDGLVTKTTDRSPPPPLLYASSMLHRVRSACHFVLPTVPASPT